MLSDEEARDLILSTCSFIDCVPSLRRSGEGGEHQAWIINEAYVLRARDDEHGYEQLEKEALLMKSLRAAAKKQNVSEDIVPLCLTTGRYHGVAFGVYEKIKGASVEDVPDAVNENTEEGLASVLRLLKSLPQDEAQALGLQEEESVDIPQLRRDALVAWERMLEKQQWPPNPKLNSLLSVDEASVDQPRSIVQHADLKGEHIFIDPDTGCLTGIIDWSDAQIGHPSVDIGGIAISIGAVAARRIAKQIGCSDGTIQRGLVVARCNAILLLDETLNVGTDCPVWLLKRQLQRALEDELGKVNSA